MQNIISVIIERCNKYMPWGKALTVSTLNQIVSSGTNFALGVYLARVLTPTEFGLFGIGLAISNFFSGVGNALFLTQMVVHVPSKALTDRIPYAARMFILLICFCMITSIVSIGIATSISEWIPWINKYAELGPCVIVASISYVIKDFFIRHSYTVRKEVWALIINTTCFVCMFTMLLAIYNFFSINVVYSIWIYATSNIIASIAGFIITDLPIMPMSFKRLMEDANESWSGGKWSLIGTIIIWAQTQAYMYITALSIGPAGVGIANASKLLISPAIFFMPAVSQVIMPRFASLKYKNNEKLSKACWYFSIILILFSLIYSLLLIGFIDKISIILLGKQYIVNIPLAIAWCSVLVFQFSRGGTSIVVQVNKKFKLLTIVNTASLSIAICSAIVLMHFMGVQGAIIGTALGELTLSITLYMQVKNLLK